MIFTPAQQTPAAKARVTPENNLYMWPRLPQSLDQEFQNRPRMTRGPAVARSQIRDKQLFATENIERQETVVTVVTVKVRALLPAMHAIIGGVKIEGPPESRAAPRRRRDPRGFPTGRAWDWKPAA